MSDPEGFISRWSRRKRAVSDAETPAEIPDEQAADAQSDSGAGNADALPVSGATKEKEQDEPRFDISTLPSIESITAGTDIRAFLLPGVPPALTKAALRRAWVVDPKIRDFIEMAENQWDFTVTGGAPGFDLSPPTGDLRQLLAQVLPSSPEEKAEEKERPPANREVAALTQPESEAHRKVTDAIPEASSSTRPEEPRPTSDVSMSNSEDPTHDDAASQKNSASRHDAHPPRRSHGRAMPR
jgi:hypothetical protein